MELFINGEEYEVLVAKTDEEKSKGLEDVLEMDDDEGMIFIYDDIQSEVSYTMKNTSIDLDIIGIDEDQIVTKVVHCKAHMDDPIILKNVQYVLELNINSGVKRGMFVDFINESDEDDFELSTMYIIGSDGKPQMELLGGERIFSRPNTKTLVSMARRAYLSKNDSDYKRLGKKVFEYLTIQNNNEPDFV